MFTQRTRVRRRAFTLIELLVVVAIIALLLAVLLPNLAAAREQGRRAKCLANLKNIATGAVLYAQEDTKNMIIPMHAGIWQNQWAFGNYLWWRLAGPASFGGRTAVQPIGNINNLVDPNGPWAADTRPLNRYMFAGGIGKQDSARSAWEMYMCPSDDGFPANPKWVPDDQVANNPAISAEVYEKRFFDILGNSYRFNYCGVISAGPPVRAQMTTSVFGSRYARLDRLASRVVLFTEPLFYMMTVPQQNLNPDLAPLAGTHRVLMTDNVVFADGSSRSTKVGRLARFNSTLLDEMGVGTPWPYDWVLRRGIHWQTDAYPIPGSLIRGYQGTVNIADQGTIDQLMGNPATRRWPGKNYQDNTLRTN
ncbi:MAG TPA: prepilin-type N-terminal cleavage/methylation domain-containing protein [Phycisphaerae bacterium]|nr:prepilin-type N-terminal cleavage/methylation domain-containing protein [Phycisphaerae bacterium]